jgi:uncharacterized MAPEG superfamily protein
MTIELWSLALSGLLCLLLPFIYVALYQKQVGAAGVSGNRDDVPEPTGAAGRGLRAHRNLQENLLPFAIVVLVAHATHISNRATVFGALLFLGARVVHAAAYLLGIRGIRTLAYIAGVAGSLTILVQLL